MALLDTRHDAFAPANIFGRGFFKLTSAVTAWRHEHATRKALSKLSDRELDDIGLSRSDIERVARHG